MVKRIVALFLLLINMGSAQWVYGEAFKPNPIITLSISEAWQRQQVILTVEVPTPDEFARLEFEELELTDFEVIDLEFERTEANGKRSIKIGWITFPLVAGQYKIELPKIVYRPSSGRKIKLKIPLQNLHVKSLPSYIPATMPIGKVEIKSTVEKGYIAILAKLHNTQTLINWNIELITNDVLPQTIPPILRQIKTNKALDVFPETSDKKQLKTYTGFQQNIHYKVPVKALQSGQLDLPKLSIQYFDPSDGKLKRANAQAPTQWALHHYLQCFLLALLLVGALFALIKIFKHIQVYRLKRRMIHQAINEIKQAKNTDEIRTALHNLSQAKGWKSNTTLQQLLMSWESQKGQDLVLDNVFKELQTAQFSKNVQISFADIKNGLINSLKQA